LISTSKSMLATRVNGTAPAQPGQNRRRRPHATQGEGTVSWKAWASEGAPAAPRNGVKCATSA